MRDTVDLLRQILYLRDLPEAELEAVASAGSVRRYDTGESIFREDEPCSGVFVLLHGAVHLCKNRPDGREQILAVMEPVAVFNAVAVLDGGPNVTTAVAAADCRAWRVTLDAFRAVMRTYPHLGLRLLPVLAARNRYLVAQYEDLSFRPVLARTAKLLLDLSDNGRRAIDRHEHSIHEMAARTATVPEAVSRSLGSLKRTGAITCSRTGIVVARPDTLAGLAHIDAALLGG